MKHIWFKEWGWLYRPQSWQGIAITFLFLLFLLNTFLAVDRHSHSVADTFYGIFPYWLPAFLFWLWLGDRTSNK